MVRNVSNCWRAVATRSSSNTHTACPVSWSGRNSASICCEARKSTKRSACFCSAIVPMCLMSWIPRERAQQTEPGQRQAAVSPSSHGIANGVAKPLRFALLGRSMRHNTVDGFQIAVEIAAGGQQQTRVLLERLFIRIERLVQRIKLRVLAIRFSIDAGRFGIGLADNLLGFPVRLRAQAVQLALLLATNLGAGAVPFGAVTRCNP